MNEKNKVIFNDHKPTNTVRQPTGDIINNHKQPTNIRTPPPPPTPAPNNGGGKK